MSFIKGPLIIALAGTLTLASCSVDDNPVSSPAMDMSTELIIQLNIQPTNALRTVETWNYWTVPVNVAFVAEIGGEETASDTNAHHGVSSPYPVVQLQKVAGISAADAADILIGSIELPQMHIKMSIGDAKELWEMEHDGALVEHHAEIGSNHIIVEIAETATGHDAHGGLTVSHCHVTLIAESATDTFEVQLVPVQTEHGLRYEANAELPYDTYNLSLEIEPPEFFRDEETMNKWTTDILAAFSGFVFDSQFTDGTVGSATWVGASDDSLNITLRAGAVATYGAVGMGMLPKSGNETINFSLKLEDPTIEAHEQPLAGSIVTLTVINVEAGSTTIKTLKPIYGHEGFYFGENMHLGLGEHGADDGGGDDH
ncbi:MAG: hypothetical protein IIA17_05795 [candidate division Zixibacteria bacterium]|nr:hypothetical protein [candidate division Zixibacteria bacterium]